MKWVLSGMGKPSSVPITDMYHLRLMQVQVDLQCQFFLFCAQELQRMHAASDAAQQEFQDFLKQYPSSDSVPHDKWDWRRDTMHALADKAGLDKYKLWFLLTNMINAAATLNRLFWGYQGGFTAERKTLRDSISVADSSPLNFKPAIRNHFEHFDERIDRWWVESPNHNCCDFMVGSPARISTPNPELDIWRCYDPSTLQVHFWGDVFDLKPVVVEVIRIAPLVANEAKKPHFEMPPQMEAALKQAGVFK